MSKKALIVANLIGFVGFLWNDIFTLQKLGFEVSFAANGNTIINENHREELKRMGITFHQIDFSSKNPMAKENFTALRELKKIIRQENFSLVHCHTPIAGFLTRVALIPYRRRGIRVIYTTHGFSFTHLSSRKEWMKYYYFEKFVSRFTDTIITINQEDFEIAQKFHCKDVTKINGVGVDTIKYHDVNIDKNKYKQKIGIPENKTVVLSVGELSERKNHQIIIKALGKLENKDEYVYVICGREVGNSGVADRLKKLAEQCGVYLLLLGHRSDIPEIMHCSDIGAIPSIREGLGLAGVQSLCAEVPLVGTNVQGIKDYIIDGVDGFLCDPFDEDGFSQAIIKLSDPSTYKKMKESCYEIAKKFDIKVSSKQMKEIYSSLL